MHNKGGGGCVSRRNRALTLRLGVEVLYTHIAGVCVCGWEVASAPPGASVHARACGCRVIKSEEIKTVMLDSVGRHVFRFSSQNTLSE